jgi:peptide/nickel transport system permease protein
MGAALLLAAVSCAVFAPWLAPFDPLEMAPDQQLMAPDRVHWAGTDLFGRDVFSRVLYGGRTTMLVGAAAVLMASVPGTALGMLAGYHGRRVDDLTMAVMNIMLAFPGILLALAIVSVSRRSTWSVIVAVGVSSVPAYTRLVRGEVLGVRKHPYVRSAISVGCSTRRILWRHILPNVRSSLLVMATLNIGWAMLNASALGFLGMGAQPPIPEWGVMLREGRDVLREAPWVACFPGLALAMVVLAVNLVGDGLRDSLDPRLR